LTFPFLPSAESVCCERPFGLNMTHTFLSHKNPKLTPSCISQATQYSPSMESPMEFPTCK
jgi:hypothetical protein